METNEENVGEALVERRDSREDMILTRGGLDTYPKKERRGGRQWMRPVA